MAKQKKKNNSRSRQQTAKNTTSNRKRRRITPEIRRKRMIQYLLKGMLLGFFIGILLFSIFKLSSILLGYKSGEKEYEQLKEQYVLEEPTAPEKILERIEKYEEENEGEGSEQEKIQELIPMTRIDLSSLKKMNSDTVGWIEIPGTVLSYPMVHTKDNSFYLTHTFRKETNKSGSIFIEALNDSAFSDLHTIIYGHNMKDGSMFAQLKNYTTESYLKAHPYIYIDLADGSHCYQIFSCHETNPEQPGNKVYTIGYKANDTYAEFLDSIKSASTFDTGVDVSIEDSVITLSTCTNNGDSRFVVHAKKLY